MSEQAFGSRPHRLNLPTNQFLNISAPIIEHIYKPDKLIDDLKVFHDFDNNSQEFKKFYVWLNKQVSISFDSINQFKNFDIKNNLSEFEKYKMITDVLLSQNAIELISAMDKDLIFKCLISWQRFILVNLQFNATMKIVY